MQVASWSPVANGTVPDLPSWLTVTVPELPVGTQKPMKPLAYVVASLLTMTMPSAVVMVTWTWELTSSPWQLPVLW